MRTITLEQANQDLVSHINYTLQTHEEVNIASSNGAIVMIPQNDYESMQETLRLLADKKSLKALLDGHEAQDAHKKSKTYSIEEVFSDL
ncbi:MAG: type II toxin-antitoxin system Phd/YefM family antitoxin [Sulfurovum sp.]|nr:type II toxin-antitoxin system Phd/YefM family antitoxin [Sulfurovaceae bacterium]